jgi:hypothetical protein
MHKCLGYLSVKQCIAGVTQPVFIHFISFDCIEYIRKYSEYKNYELKHAWTNFDLIVATISWLTAMGYLCHKLPRICSTCRKHFPVLSSLTTYYRVCN